MSLRLEIHTAHLLSVQGDFTGKYSKNITSNDFSVEK